MNTLHAHQTKAICRWLDSAVDAAVAGDCVSVVRRIAFAREELLRATVSDVILEAVPVMALAAE